MAEALGVASSVIAVGELAAKVGKTCLEYCKAFKCAEVDIDRSRRSADRLSSTLDAIQSLLEGSDGRTLAMTQKISESLEECRLELLDFQVGLAPFMKPKGKRDLGFRSFKWALNGKENREKLINLDRRMCILGISLQVDQTQWMFDVCKELKDIRHRSGQPSTMVCEPWYSVPFDRDLDFVARPDVMSWIESKYADWTSRIALVGLGGIGKSQIAIQFAHLVHDTSPQTSIFWVCASSEQTFEQAYQAIADRIRLPGRNESGVNVLQLVCKWFENQASGRWLIILDNVDDADLFFSTSRDRAKYTTRLDSHSSEQQPLAAFLPRRRGGSILVTSRSLDAAEKLTDSHRAICPVSIMDGPQALQLFRNKLQGSFDEDAATELLMVLDYIPLAISQAAAYINRRAPRVSIKTYLDTLKENDNKKRALLARDAGHTRRDETVSNSVIFTWQVTFDHIRQVRPSAADLLTFMSFFNPHDIPDFALRNYNVNHGAALDDDTDCSGSKCDHEVKFEEDIEDDLDVLRGYSLISMHSDPGLFEMHSLVQFCTRAWVSMAGDEAKWKGIFLKAMCRHFPTRSFKAYTQARIILPHVHPLLEEKAADEDFSNWLFLASNCAVFYAALGQYTLAEEIAQKAIEGRWIDVEGGDIHTITSSFALGYVYLKQGLDEAAERLLEKSLALCNKAGGEHHTATSQIVNGLASLYQRQKKWKAAEEVISRARHSAEKTYGEKHRRTQGYDVMLGRVYLNENRFEEAESILSQVVDTTTQTGVEADQLTAMSLTTLASLYRRRGEEGDQSRAESFLKRAVKISGETSGDENLATLVALEHWALFLNREGRLEEASEAMTRLLESFTKMLGPDHLITLRSALNLVNVYIDQGRVQEAHKLFSLTWDRSELGKRKIRSNLVTGKLKDATLDDTVLN